MNLRSARIAFATAALCAFNAPAAPGLPAPAQASDFVIDQTQPVSLFALTNLPPNASRQSVWQSFQPSADVISGAGMFLFPGIGVSGQVRIELWDGPPKTVPGATNGQRLAFAGATGVAGTWADVFWTPLPAEPGRTYFLSFEGMGQGKDLALSGATGSLYPQGSLFLDDAEFPAFDATFRTFAPVIPEPSGALLLLVGLTALGVVVAVRRRARSIA